MLNIKANYSSVTFKINCIATVKSFLLMQNRYLWGDIQRCKKIKRCSSTWNL